MRYAYSDESRAQGRRVGHTVVGEWVYRDGNGRAGFMIQKLEPKSFRQLRLMPDGTYGSGMKKGWYRKGRDSKWFRLAEADQSNCNPDLDIELTSDQKTYPYRMDEILAADPAATKIAIVEGEKDAERTQAELGDGWIVTTAPGGAGNKKWKESWSELFRGFEVVAIPDRDAPNAQRVRVGYSFMSGVCDSVSAHANSTRLILIPVEDSQDISDWWDEGHTAAELEELVANTAEWKTNQVLPGTVHTPSQDEHQTHLDMLGIEVAGLYGDGTIKLYNCRTGQFRKFPNIDRMTLCDILALCGPDAGLLVHTGQAVPKGAQGFLLKSLKESISSIAFDRTTDDAEDRRTGIWFNKPERDLDGNEIGELTSVFVNRGHLSTWTLSEGFNLLRSSRYDGDVYDVGGRLWYDHAEMAEQFTALQEPRAQDRIDRTINNLLALLRKWFWEYPETDPQLFLSLMFAQTIQHVFENRPLVTLIGATGSGKSFLLEELYAKLFPDLAMVLGPGTTPAGMRQSIQNSCIPMVIDEIHKNRHQTEIMNLLRTALRGGRAVLGTKDQKELILTLHHLVMICGEGRIQIDESDQNRSIYMKVKNFIEKKINFGTWKTENPMLEDLVLDFDRAHSLKATGMFLMAAVVSRAPRILELCQYLRGQPTPDHVDSRLASINTIPAAVYAALRGMSDSSAAEVLAGFLGRVQPEDAVESDPDSLLRIVMSLTERIPTDGGGWEIASIAGKMKRFLAMGPWANQYSGMAGDEAVKSMFAQRGLAAVTPRSGSGKGALHLFIAVGGLKKYLRGSPFEKYRNLQDILLQIPNAYKSQQRVDGEVRPQGIMVPWTYLNTLFQFDKKGEDEELTPDDFSDLAD